MSISNVFKLVNILLVEDDSVDAEAVERSLRSHDIDSPITVARDGAEALDHLRGTNGKAPIPKPHLVLLDLNMPGMNGLEFLRELRQDDNLRATLTFVLTTSNDPRDREATYDQNVAGYIVKSHTGEDFEELMRLIERAWKLGDLTDDAGA